MKENKEIMSEKIAKIGTIAIECLNGRNFNKVLLGLIINTKNDTDVRNIEFFYKDLDDNTIYFNEVVYDDKFNDSIEEQKYLQLQDLLFDFYKYCVECGDEWKYMTLLVNSDKSFSVDLNMTQSKLSIGERITIL